jgi:putative membrane protein (TIGR04086 family)
MERALKKRVVSPVVKGVLSAVCFSVVAVLIFAITYRFVELSDLTIMVINQVIKILSILLGVSICVKHDRTKGALKGAIIGILYVLLSYTIFSALVSSFSFSLSIVYDIIFSVVVGIICGVFLVGLKK